MIFFDKTRTIGQDANGKNVVWVSVYVDTAANLPAYNDYQSDGFILCMASEGRCIDTGDLYRLDSSGVWQISQAGTGTYTKAEIDALLNEKQDVLTFDATPTQNSTNPVTSSGIWTDQQRQEAEIGAVANAGAKNDFDIENLIKSAISENVTYSLSGYSLTAFSNGRYARASIPYKFKAGTTVFSVVVSDFSLSGGTMYIRFATQSSSAGQIASEIEITGNGQYQREITVNADTDGFVIYYMNGSPDTYVNSAVFTNNMIRPAAITDQTFQPYAPTNRELYEMILALQ